MAVIPMLRNNADIWQEVSDKTVNSCRLWVSHPSSVLGDRTNDDEAQDLAEEIATASPYSNTPWGMQQFSGEK